MRITGGSDLINNQGNTKRENMKNHNGDLRSKACVFTPRIFEKVLHARMLMDTGG